MKLKNLILASLILASSSISFAENRITGPADPAKRCTANPPKSACNGINVQETEKGCITAEERDTLNHYGAFAQCQDITVKGETVRVLAGWCACGCFAPKTKIAAAEKETGIARILSAWETAHNRANLNLVSLNENYLQGEKFSYQQTPIILSTEGPEQKPLVVIKTDLQRSIAITENHPVLRSNFKMTKASKLKVGDELLTETGAPTKIVSIDRKRTNAPVVNFVTGAESDFGHVIFAEGLTVGDMKWQAALSDEEKAVQARQ